MIFRTTVFPLFRARTAFSSAIRVPTLTSLSLRSFNNEVDYQRRRLASLENEANTQPNNADLQYSLLREYSRVGLFHRLVERFESQRYRFNEEAQHEYLNALKMIGKTSHAEASSNLSSSSSSSSSHTPPSSPFSEEFAPSSFHTSAPQSSQFPFLRSSSSLGTHSNPIYFQLTSKENPFWKALRVIATVGFLAFILMQLNPQLAAKGISASFGGGFKELEPQEDTGITFNDVKGAEEAKNELIEVVQFLKNPEQFSRLGGKMPKGLLLVGPPGTGKTLLAKAVAGEAGVPFFYTSGSEFEEVYVGVGARRIRDLFAAAKKKAPCIIFIDEIDAVGGKRNGKEHQALRATLNQLLVELDGFKENNGVIVVAATNFVEALDPALTRPGRFDRHVTMHLPDLKGRKEILELYGNRVTLGSNCDLSKIARGTPGCSGADLFNLINSAAIQAAKLQHSAITHDDLEWARDKVLMGSERKSMSIDPLVKRVTAFHEGGHTLVSLLTPGSAELHKVTILPRGPALGITFSLSDDKREFQRTTKELLAEMDVCMGGRVAEELIFGTENITSGASSDFRNATRIARMLVTQMGVSDRLGKIFISDINEASPATQKIVEEEVQKLIDESYTRAKNLLTSHRKELENLAHALIEFETLDKEEVQAVMKGDSLPKVL